VSRLSFMLLAGMLLGPIGVGAPALANDGSRDGAVVPQEVQPPSGESVGKPGAREPFSPQVTRPMMPGCPYRGAKLELIV
jgi:hypothetical protein